MTPTDLDHATCYQAVSSRDRRFDGVFYTAVATTGIYCRPSCPARTPAAANVTFYRTAAAAQAAGYRACKRCIPDATPGSPDWDWSGATAGRAMRLIADGVVDREGVPGLARRVGYTPRHLTRLLTRELGAGPLALARARRAQTARILIDSTGLQLAEIAFAAGFSSIRQFNDTIREVYGVPPSALRGLQQRPPSRAGHVPPSGAEGRPARSGHPGYLRLNLAVRTPFHGPALLAFLAPRAVAGIEAVGDDWYSRTLALPHAPGALRLTLPTLPHAGGTGIVTAELWLGDLRDIAAAVERARRLLDADCDPVAVATALGGDPLLGRLVGRWPGLRVPGHTDGAELAVRAIVGQQISVAGARTVLGRLVERAAAPLAGSSSDAGVPPMPQGLTHLFPAPDALAALDPAEYPMPRARGRALGALTSALASGDLALDRGPDRDETRERLLALPGIGEWTADYIAIRALGHPDAFMPTDLGTRHALAGLGVDPLTAAALAERWRPWRSYSQSYLWTTLLDVPGVTHVESH